jgi:hypothetical protein
MARGMFVFRIVAATDVATRQAHAQVHPGVAHLQAFFAAVGIGVARRDLVEMGAIMFHADSLLESGDRSTRRLPLHDPP